MQNYVKEGKILTLTAPYARSAGQGALVGSIFGVACSDVENAAEGEFQTEGVFALTKAGSQAWAVGDKIYWNNSNKECTTDSAAGQLIGVATEVVGSGADATTGNVRLNGAAPAMLEGPQAAVADLTDNSGGATADGTIGAVTAPTALTDNTTGVAATTLAAVTNPTLSDWNGSSVYPSAAQATAINAAITSLKNAVAQFAVSQGEDRTAIIALTDAVKELSTKLNATLAKLRLAGIIAS